MAWYRHRCRQEVKILFQPVLIPPSLFIGLSAGSFTLLAYTSTQDPLPLPEKWNDADPHLIDKGKVEQVRLRSFSTNVHKMEVSALEEKDAEKVGCQRRFTEERICFGCV